MTSVSMYEVPIDHGAWQRHMVPIAWSLSTGDLRNPWEDTTSGETLRNTPSGPILPAESRPKTLNPPLSTPLRVVGRVRRTVLLGTGIILTCLLVQGIVPALGMDDVDPSQALPIHSIEASSGAPIDALVDGNESSYWRSSERLGPGRREWIELHLCSHFTIEEARLKSAPNGGFPTGFRITFSTDGGETYFEVSGGDFRGYPDPGGDWCVVDIPDVISDSVKLEAYYLRQDDSGHYVFQLAEIVLVGSPESGPFFTSRGGEWDADLNMMWRIFGSAEPGLGAVAPMGGESAWMEWNALKLCWYDDPGLRDALRRQFIGYTVDADGYVWSWGDQEGWPTHGHRHYDTNPKFILGASRYYLWTGDDSFLQSCASSTTDMSLSIDYVGRSPSRWDSPNHVAIRLTEGETLGQSFLATDNFTSVGGSFPTYLTTGSSMTLRLRSGGPTGEVLSESRFSDVVDNAWASLSFDPLPPGRYYLEMCCPDGTVGWWSINDDVIANGSFHVNGEVFQRDGRSILERIRSAMRFQLNALDGRNGLLVIGDNDSNGTYNGYPTDYWDNFPFGYESAYINTYFYASLAAMADLEEAVGNETGASYLRGLMPLVRRRFNEVFWDDGKGRYIGCVDSQGGRHDLGFTYINTEAMAYGLADGEKARMIYSWLDGERIIPGEISQGDDIYHYVIAPRSTTLPAEGTEPYWWYSINGAISLGPGGTANYDDHLENGGVIFYTSYYDLMSRLLFISADDALGRLDAIMTEFHKDHLIRDPPNSKGVPWKLGIIGEFPESGLVPSFVVHGLLGAEARPDGLHLLTRLPQNLSWIGVRDLCFRGARYTINATREAASPSITGSGDRYLVTIPIGESVVLSGGEVWRIEEGVTLLWLIPLLAVWIWHGLRHKIEPSTSPASILFG